MSSDRTVLFVAGDPGGAAALLPVIKGWQGNAVVLGYRQATKIFTDARLEVCPLDENKASAFTAEAWIDKTQPGLVFGATSLNGVDWEPRFFAAARKKGIPSLSLLDYWSNYTPRFTFSEPLDALPDAIAIMDDRARTEMISEGFPEDRLIVTGQPVLDEVRIWRMKQPPDVREKGRQKLGIDGNTRLYLFVSQPLSMMNAITGKTAPHEFEAFDLLLNAVVKESKSNPVRLLIKLHPREDTAKYDQRLSSADGLAAVAPPSLHRWELCLAADQVVGISSMLLHEASALGCHVVRINNGEFSSVSSKAVAPDVKESFPLAADRILSIMLERFRPSTSRVFAQHPPSFAPPNGGSGC